MNDEYAAWSNEHKKKIRNAREVKNAWRINLKKNVNGPTILSL